MLNFINFLKTFYFWSTMIGIVMLGLLAYAAMTVKVSKRELLTHFDEAEERMSKGLALLQALLAFIIAVASISESLFPLIEKFTLEGHEDPVQAAIATSICYTLSYLIVMDLFSMIIVWFRTRYLRTEALNEIVERRNARRNTIE